MNKKVWLDQLMCNAYGTIAHYIQNTLEQKTKVHLTELNENHAVVRDSKWEVNYTCINVESSKGGMDLSVKYKLKKGNIENCCVGLELEFDQWDTDNYVLIPGAAYNGNRFESRKIPYSPKLMDAKDIGVDIPTIISDVPRLNINEGESLIQLLAGDMTTPSIGFYSPKKKMGFWILTEQRSSLGETGIKIQESEDRSKACINITMPGMREKYKYKICNNSAVSEDRGADFTEGDEVILNVRLYSFGCRDIQTLFDKFTMIRKDLESESKMINCLPFSAAWDIHEKKYNLQNWVEEHGYYSLGMRENFLQNWQIGWTGGMISTYPLLFAGNDLSIERVKKNFDYVLPWLIHL